MGTDTTATKLITAINKSFCRTAAPDIFWSDISSITFQGFKHWTSSPYYLHSGKREVTVKSMKKIIHAAWKGRYLDKEFLCRALLQYRNTPSAEDRQSPAQKLYGDPIQGTILAHDQLFDMTWQSNAVEAKAKATGFFFI